MKKEKIQIDDESELPLLKATLIESISIVCVVEMENIETGEIIEFSHKIKREIENKQE